MKQSKINQNQNHKQTNKKQKRKRGQPGYLSHRQINHKKAYDKFTLASFLEVAELLQLKLSLRKNQQGEADTQHGKFQLKQLILAED